VGRRIEIDDGDLRKGLLGLVVALVEVIHEALRVQAVRRMEAGDLREDEVDRVGRALREVEEVLEAFKRDQGLEDAVREIRRGLDGLAARLLDPLRDPEGGAHERVG
jgi:hypothetical protein